jgi:hypothetical protein
MRIPVISWYFNYVDAKRRKAWEQEEKAKKEAAAKK